MLAAAAALILPAAAQASFARVDSAGKLTYTPVIGEVNQLALSSPSPGVVRLNETGHLGVFPVWIAGSGGCSGLAAAIECTGVTSIAINTGDQADTVSARDGLAEHVACGSGADSVTADAGDSVTDCETVDLPAEPGSDPPEPEPGADPTAPGHALGADTQDAGYPPVNLLPPTIPAQTAGVTASGVALVQVACPPAAGVCKGSVELVVTSGGAAARRGKITAARRRRTTRLGGASFVAKAGEKPIVRIRLNRRGRRRILRHRHTRCRLVVTTRTADGRTVTTARQIKLERRSAAHRLRKNKSKIRKRR